MTAKQIEFQKMRCGAGDDIRMQRNTASKWTEPSDAQSSGRKLFPAICHPVATYQAPVWVANWYTWPSINRPPRNPVKL